VYCLESGQLEFEEFLQLATKFMNEEDEEEMEKELREAFRLYDKEGEFGNSCAPPLKIETFKQPKTLTSSLIKLFDTDQNSH